MKFNKWLFLQNDYVISDLAIFIDKILVWPINNIKYLSYFSLSDQILYEHFMLSFDLQISSLSFEVQTSRDDICLFYLQNYLSPTNIRSADINVIVWYVDKFT